MTRCPTGNPIGRLEWIGIRPGRREPLECCAEAVLTPGRGIAGDHFRPRPQRPSEREVTLIQHEHLAEIAERTGREFVAPYLLRRNLVVSGIELRELINRQFRIGDVILRATGPCTPCARMDEALGEGGRRAMSGRGGITAVIISGGTIHVGDSVRPY